MSMADDFVEMRDDQRRRKRERVQKFAADRGWIARSAADMGWEVSFSGPDGAWVFRHEGSGQKVTWWPGSGKTSEGLRFGTWPALKRHLHTLNGGAS